ncbi:MAG TPA: LptE family protein [Flavobacteriales bacterium]
MASRNKVLRTMKGLLSICFALAMLTGCTVQYSMTGGQFGNAKTFSVDYFKPQTGLATPTYAQLFSESLKDFLLAQSPLKLRESDGDLQFSGSIVEYHIAPASATGGNTEIASMNRLTIGVKVKYVNTLEEDLNFEKSFSKFADFEADKDLFAVEEELWKIINEQLIVEIYNASVGNW